MSDWKTVDDFAAGIDGNRLPRTSLAGTRWTVRADEPVELAFGESTVEWDGGAGEYEAVEGAPGTLFVNHRVAEREARVIVADLATLRAIVVTSTIAETATPGVPQVSQRFSPGVLDVGDDRAVTGEPPAPTRDLIGWRALYRYSPDHLYEHVYLSSERYAWQCLVGAQRGHGDVDLATAWRLAPNRYVFTFREFRIPVATTWLYDLDALRTTGAFFGLNGDGEVRDAPGGAHIIPLGRVTYPDAQPV